jgi:hypothetical protein
MDSDRYTRPAAALQQTPSSMRRFLSIVLMLVLSLQATWSAAASVCRHDVAVEAPHFGHHAHADEAAPTHAVQSDDAAGVQIPHLDCVGCHGGLCAVLLHAPVSSTAESQPDAAATPYRRSITDGLPERLIRPPHSFLA